MTATIVSTSTEYVWVPLRSEHPIDGPANLAAYTVDLAFVTGGDPAPSDWHPATWEPATKTIGGDTYYLARLLVGPAGDVALTDGPWNVYARVTLSDQAPVVRAGILEVT